jgi:hypothetical protein
MTMFWRICEIFEYHEKGDKMRILGQQMRIGTTNFGNATIASINNRLFNIKTLELYTRTLTLISSSVLKKL